MGKKDTRNGEVKNDRIRNTWHICNNLCYGSDNTCIKSRKIKMIEFDYKLDYKNTLFRPNDKRYRIGRGEQGVLLVRPYTDVICKH